MSEAKDSPRRSAPPPSKRGAEEGRGYGFGTFQGVFTPSILTIIGVVMYLRFGWVLGNLGLGGTLFLVTLCSSVTFVTGLSISALATNMRMKGGGAYFMISRSFGVESGAALGIPIALMQAVGTSFYVAGFSEALVHSGLPYVTGLDARVVGLATLGALTVLSMLSADLALRAQYVIMAAIVASLVSFFLGGAPEGALAPAAGAVSPSVGFWPVLAVFFPAVTGILSGVGMSGDLRDPGKSIPRGTLAAVLTGYIVYMAVPVALQLFVRDSAVLRTDLMVFQKCARWEMPVMLGVWAATLSSAIGSLLAAPRVVQALARDSALPRFLGRGFGRRDDPRVATLATFVVAGAGIALGDINAIAPVLTMFNLTTYALLNLSAALEEAMGNPSWRPTFRVRSWVCFAGFLGCVAMMFMISPGWTFVAMAFEAAVYWLMKRRALRARWGDMRLGLLMSAARIVVRALSRRAWDGRNWRPVLLVLAGASARLRRLVEIAGAISRNKSLVTVAAIVPEDAWSAERAETMRGALRDALQRRGIEAQVRIQPGVDHWAGMRELARAYGWGPLVPNTVLFGPATAADTEAPCGEFVKLLVSRGRNVLVVCDNAAEEDGAVSGAAQNDGAARTIDIWWRGRQGNAPFMLALACLLRRADEWRGANLRICHLLEEGARPEEAHAMLEGFLASARVEAEPVIVTRDDAPTPVDRIRQVSRGSDLVLLGLRRPAGDEPASGYGAYLRFYQERTADLPLVVFALAAENVDFGSIFS